jgi:hypothetical protein
MSTWHLVPVASSHLITCWFAVLVALSSQGGACNTLKPRSQLLQQSILGVMWAVGLFFFVILGFEHRAYTLSHSTKSFFVMDFFFEISSHKLIALAGFKP